MLGVWGGTTALGLDETDRALVAELTRNGVLDIDARPLMRALYSTDASLYRVVPRLVVRPRDLSEVVAAVDACARIGVPITARGAGTSIAGNAVGPGVVMDFRRHLGRVVSIDPEERTATVEPGVVHSALQRAAASWGLRFGPDPSTHSRCTIGGMIGNNACGSRALGYGRTADNVVGLDIITADGERLRLGPRESAESSPTLAALDHLVRQNLATVRPQFGQFGRQVSGYSLEHLLPERGFDVAKFLAGSEGTLAVLLGATVRLVAEPKARCLVALGYPDMATAADDVPAALVVDPTACEGLDARIVDVVRASGGSVPELPPGRGWLFVEVAADNEGELAERATRLLAETSSLGSRVVTQAAEQAELWRIREEGAGLAARALPRPALSGWEDAAVPPHRLGQYLREFELLLTEYGLEGVPYGHFGDGCVHVRIDFPLAEDNGPKEFRRFLFDAARLVASHGGSLSGEHGDGRARSELLPVMYSPEAVELFGAVKAIFDPRDLLNPGVLVRPRALDEDLRIPRPQHREHPGLRLVHDAGDIATAVHRCTGVGKCVADSVAPGSVMCPSYQATRDEKDSTRGRARALQEMVDGRLITDGWRSDEVWETLDLCLSCKGCLSDCPTGVDMASYKSEFLYQRYRRRLRPRSHYALGWLPRWARLASPLALLLNTVLRSRIVGYVAKSGAGVDQRRNMPRLARVSFRRWARRRTPKGGALGAVVLWADTFTDFFSASQGRAAVRVLEAAGYRVEVPRGLACCGLTWISTGQLDGARKQLVRLLDALYPYVRDGIPVVALEPSCLSVLRSDAGELLDDPRVPALAKGVLTMAELLTRTPSWQAPDLHDLEVIVQPHCHHSAVLGFDADEDVLRATGARVTRLGGCCGLAGNFGVERGHYEVSVAVADQQLLPAVVAAPDSIVLADGFSCRTQIEDLAGRPSLHLVELLDQGMRGSTPPAQTLL